MGSTWVESKIALALEYQFPKVYDKIDVKMDQRRLKQREKKMREQIKDRHPFK